MQDGDLIILGSSGFIGSSIQYFITKFQQQNCFHFISRSKNKIIKKNVNIFFHTGCVIKNLQKILNEAKDNKRFIIINLIGSLTDDLEKLKQIENLTYSILSVINHHNTKKLLQISSSSVYNGLDLKLDLEEVIFPFSKNNYGKSKLNLENFILSSPINDISTIIRLGNVLGGDSLTKNFQNSQNQIKILDIYRDGQSAMRTYIDPLNLSKILITLGKKEFLKNSIYNCGTSTPFYMEEVLKSFKIDYKTKYSNNSGNQYFTLNINSLSKEIGCDLTFSLEEMVNNTISFINKK